jgi:esterase/lipase superfamily enzyme
MGRLERPSIWKFQFREDPEKHVVIITSEEKDLSAWTAIARERLTISDQKSALIFIHGFNVTFEDAIRRTAQIGWDLQFNGVITTFSWCSEGRKRSYLTDERNARLAAPRLFELLEILRKDVGVESIQVIAHSMGNLVLMEALRKLAADRHPLTLDEVIFAAPDCDAVEFRRALGEFKEKARRYTLYGSEADLALRISKDIRSDYPRAGDGGERILVVEGLETIDATAIGEDMLGLGHSYFAAKRTVLSDLFYLIQESLPAARRSGMEERQQSGVDYWLFVP